MIQHNGHIYNIGYDSLSYCNCIHKLIIIVIYSKFSSNKPSNSQYFRQIQLSIGMYANLVNPRHKYFGKPINYS